MDSWEDLIHAIKKYEVNIVFIIYNYYIYYNIYDYSNKVLKDKYYKIQNGYNVNTKLNIYKPLHPFNRAIAYLFNCDNNKSDWDEYITMDRIRAEEQFFLNVHKIYPDMFNNLPLGIVMNFKKKFFSKNKNSKNLYLKATLFFDDTIKIKTLTF